VHDSTVLRTRQLGGSLFWLYLHTFAPLGAFLILVPVRPSLDNFDDFDERPVCGEVKKRWITLNMAGKNSDRFDIVNGKQLALLIAPTICFVVASAVVAARWYTRSVRRVNTLGEDALMVAALVRLQIPCCDTMLTPRRL
jgi:hypothetical protein